MHGIIMPCSFRVKCKYVPPWTYGIYGYHSYTLIKCCCMFHGRRVEGARYVSYNSYNIAKLAMDRKLLEAVIVCHTLIFIDEFFIKTTRQ